MCKVLRYLVILWLMFPLLAEAQRVEVRSRFLEDTLRIGQPVPFSLTARYPRKLNVLYPDSTYDFTPFELEKREYFPTRSTDSLSYDSVVYYISSFEIDSIQRFRMPVFVLHGSDCTTYYGALDSITAKQLVAHVPDSVETAKLPLKTNTNYQSVGQLFNYLLAANVVVALLVIGIIGWVAFGDRIRRYFAVRRLTRAHETFIKRFGDQVQQVQDGKSVIAAESALASWKRYMESLFDRPFAMYSSKEITTLLKNERLAPILWSVDRMIYGGAGRDTTPFEQLREISTEYFQQKLKEVNHE